MPTFANPGQNREILVNFFLYDGLESKSKADITKLCHENFGPLNDISHT